jgi:hypothetical protein
MRSISQRIARSAFGLGTDQFRDVADGRGLGLYLPTFGGHAGKFRLPALGVQNPAGEPRGWRRCRPIVARDVTVRELTALLADWEAERQEKGRAQVRTRLLD